MSGAGFNFETSGNHSTRAWIPEMNKLIPVSKSVCSGLVGGGVQGWGDRGQVVVLA